MGTRKSYLINNYIESKYSCIKCGSTGVAALNINSPYTVHSLFNIKCKNEYYKQLKNIENKVIDLFYNIIFKLFKFRQKKKARAIWLLTSS